MDSNKYNNKNLLSSFIFEWNDQILPLHEIQTRIKAYSKQGGGFGTFFGYSEPCQF